ncbi:MAG: hypothetical protein DLM55_11555 [Acidimicrobiales bacterium]|nr:MAG: hypothetical protein DLM55_11555 [Acidimicrobiales bacterium]
MKRGEIWSYVPQGSPRKRTVLIVSANGVNDSTRRWFYAVEIVDSDPQDILSVRMSTQSWISGTSLTRVLRDWLTEPVGSVSEDIMDAVAAALRAALSL